MSRPSVIIEVTIAPAFLDILAWEMLPPYITNEFTVDQFVLCIFMWEIFPLYVINEFALDLILLFASDISSPYLSNGFTTDHDFLPFSDFAITHKPNHIVTTDALLRHHSLTQFYRKHKNAGCDVTHNPP
jgi:hypothetical protein